MSWPTIIQIFTAFLYAFSASLSILTARSSKKTVSLYRKSMDDMETHFDTKELAYRNAILHLEEEIHLLKTNEGLYDVRKNQEKYQLYLALLRKE